MRELMKRYDDAVQLVTTTTRPRREGEKDSVDYYFISRDAFEKNAALGGFVEYNEYNGNLYGTAWHELNACLATHTVVFSQAEVHGKANLDAAKLPHISIFLLPEDLRVLEQRLRSRGGMKDEDIAERLRIAKEEIAASKSYDLRVVNKDGRFAETVEEIANFLKENKGL